METLSAPAGRPAEKPAKIKAEGVANSHKKKHAREAKLQQQV